MTEVDKRVSDQLVRLVQIIFGFVLAQSIGRYDDVVLNPFGGIYRLQAVALLGVYVTTVLSWIDWHVTMVLRPYNFNPQAGRRVPEELRLFSDLFIVSAYAFLLLAVREIGTSGDADLTKYLVGYVGVFVGYLSSGLLRRWTYGPVASAIRPIAIFLCLNGIVFATYEWLADDSAWSTWLYVLVPVGMMVAYRIVRRHLRKQKEIAKRAGLRIGFDVDGVLANQINGVLPRIRRRLGMDLSYDDVTDWRLPLGDTDIANEIGSAMTDPDYIMGMQPHVGAQAVLNALYPHHTIKVLTARPPDAEQWTGAWLDKNALNHDGIASVREKEKSLLATDILVDDYIGNISEYLGSTNGTAILVDQPWNRDRTELMHHLEDGRLFVIKALPEVLPLIQRIHRSEQTRGKGKTAL